MNFSMNIGFGGGLPADTTKVSMIRLYERSRPDDLVTVLSRVGDSQNKLIEKKVFP